MTREEVARLTGLEFEFYATYINGSIAFCGPIPGNALVYGWDADGNLALHDPTDIWQSVWDKYIAGLQAPKREYRTRSRAGHTDALPKNIPSITLCPYREAVTFRDTTNAHLVVVGENITRELQFNDNRLFYRGMEISKVDSDGLLYNSGLHVALSAQALPPSDTDLQTLRYLYGIILQKYSQNIEEIIRKVGEDPRQFLSHSVTIYMPDYVRAIGLADNFNQSNILRIVGKISEYSQYFGVLESGRSGDKVYYAYRPVIVGLGYDEASNTLTFVSPYMNEIIVRVLQASVRLDKRGEPERSRGGQLLTKPSHSHRVQRSILKERNVRAREVVHIVCDLIDEAGHNTPNISFRTIIEKKFPQLRADLDRMSSTAARNRMLKTTFSAAWRYLPKHTDLREVYKNIRLPDPSNPGNIPTMKTLDDVVRFPHEGRVKRP